MTQHDPNLASRSVGTLNDLPDLEASAIEALRQWCSGPNAQAKVWNALAETLGPAQGRSALQSLEEIVRICSDFGHRTPMRKDIGCAGLSADEACFARLISAASSGSREEAFMTALFMVRADQAPAMAEAAAVFGLSLRRASLLHERESRTLH